MNEQIVALVTKWLDGPPRLCGMAAGSAMENAAIDRWFAELKADAQRLLQKRDTPQARSLLELISADVERRSTYVPLGEVGGHRLWRRGVAEDQ